MDRVTHLGMGKEHFHPHGSAFIVLHLIVSHTVKVETVGTLNVEAGHQQISRSCGSWEFEIVCCVLWDPRC